MTKYCYDINYRVNEVVFKVSQNAEINTKIAFMPHEQNFGRFDGVCRTCRDVGMKNLFNIVVEPSIQPHVM